jgi:hypothetical protein
MADGIRSAAQRARGLAEALAGEVAQALNVPGASANSGSGSALSSAGVAATAAAVGGASGHQEADVLWRPLLDWPLLPLADGRLLKLRYRELALAVLPEYQQTAAGASKKDQNPAGAEVRVLAWSWYLHVVVGGLLDLQYTLASCACFNETSLALCPAVSACLVCVLCCAVCCRCWPCMNPGTGYCQPCALQDSPCWIRASTSSLTPQRAAAAQTVLPQQPRHRWRKEQCPAQRQQQQAQPPTQTAQSLCWHCLCTWSSACSP